MNRIQILGLGLSFSGLLSPAVFAQNDRPHPCDSFNYLQTEDGECIDLSYLSRIPPEPLENQFYRSLEKIGVKVIRQNCDTEEASISYGYYLSGENIMQICINNTKGNPKQFIDTLVHESWHTVQDCESGLEDGNLTPIANSSGQFGALLQSLGIYKTQDITSQLAVNDLEDIALLYPPEDFELEIEARFMQDYPQTVLDALDRCR